MAITLAGTSSTQEEYKAALESHGFESDGVTSYGEGEPEKTEETKEPESTTEEVQPEQVAEAAKVEDKTADTQELSEEEQEQKEREDEAKVLKGELPERFEGEKRLLKRIDKLTGRLKTESGSRAKLEDQITELRQEQADKVPDKTEPEVEVQQKPEAPKRPKRSDHNFDDEAFEAAMEKYDAEMQEYTEKLTDWKTEQKLSEEREKREETEAKTRFEQRQTEYKEALAEHGDIKAVIESHGGVEFSSAMQAVLEHLLPPKKAALVVAYLAHHPEESKEIAEATLASSDRPGVQESNALISQASLLLGEVAASAKAWKTPKAEKKDEKPAAEPPAKPKPKVTAAAPPMQPVTARPGTPGIKSTKDIKTSDPNALKDYERIRNAGRS